MLKSLFGGRNRALPAAKLPQIHSLIDVTVGGRALRSVSVESIGPRGIGIGEVLGKPGETAVLVYTSMAGKFRAQSKITVADAYTTHLELPKRVALIGAATGAQKRQSVRLDTLVTGQWRSAPGGKGIGEFARATLRDISRGGCSLIMDRALKLGTMVEVKMMLSSQRPPLTLLSEVMRNEHIDASGKESHGLRFHGVRAEEDQAIIDFINHKQTDLRNRGLV